MALSIAALRAKVNENLKDFSEIVPSQHREVEHEIINLLEDLMNRGLPVQKGYISGLNIGTGITGFGGDLQSVVVTNGPSYETHMICTLKTPVSGAYKVSIDLQGAYGNKANDNDVFAPIFEIVSDTQFWISVDEPAGRKQNLTLLLEIKQINY